MELAQYVGSWGLCNPKPEFIEERTDTCDLRHLVKRQPFWLSYGTIYQCVAFDNDSLILTNGFKNFRTIPKMYTNLPPAKFKWGDIVYHWQNDLIIYRVEIANMLNIVYWFDYQLIAAKDIDFD